MLTNMSVKNVIAFLVPVRFQGPSVGGEISPRERYLPEPKGRKFGPNVANKQRSKLLSTQQKKVKKQTKQTAKASKTLREITKAGIT